MSAVTTEPSHRSDAKKLAIRELQSRVQGGLETLDPAKIKDPFAGLLSKTNLLAALSIPISTFNCTTQPGLGNTPTMTDPNALWVGIGGVIPRWKKGSIVNFAAYAGGYPTPDMAVFAAYRLWYAAQAWNKADVGVTFKWVTPLADAEFVLGYGGDGGSTLARSFFPNSADLNHLYVYKLAFDPKYLNYQTNIFEHELGHVIGLRHEFADQEGGAVQWGPRNPNSVMSYVFPPQIQPSDVTYTKSFYDFNGHKIGTLNMQVLIPDN